MDSSQGNARPYTSLERFIYSFVSPFALQDIMLDSLAVQQLVNQSKAFISLHLFAVDFHQQINQNEIDNSRIGFAAFCSRSW